MSFNPTNSVRKCDGMQVLEAILPIKKLHTASQQTRETRGFITKDLLRLKPFAISPNRWVGRYYIKSMF